MKRAECLFFDEENGVLLIGGTNHIGKNSRRAAGVVYLLAENQLAHATTFEMFSQTVLCVKKYKQFYLCATRGAVQILRAVTSRELKLVRTLEHHLGNLINDMCVVDDHLFTVSRSDDCIQVSSLHFLSSI